MSNYKMYANLHNHTTHSDGVYDPAEIVAIAKKEGYKAFAVTDHDTATACEPVRIECEKQGLEWVFGVEFSSPCVELGTNFHIVGFHFDSEYAPMKKYLEERSFCETYQTKTLFERGINEGLLSGITWEEILEYNAGITWLCNEHVFRAMKAKGLKKDTDYPEFFNTVYGKRRREVKLPYDFKQAHEIVKLINDAGGMAVVAHPQNQLQYIEELIKMGVAGIECWHSLLRYPDNTQELEALKLAKKYDLFVSGGSDHDGLCGGQYERYENLEECRFYHTECSLGTREEFFREIKNFKKSSDRTDILDHYIRIQEEIIKEGSVI